MMTQFVGKKRMLGMLLPEQMALAQKIYKGILKEPWFVRSLANERDCAAMIVRAMQSGTGDGAEFARQTKAIARQRFSSEKGLNGNLAKPS